LRVGGDAGTPIVVAEPDAPAAVVLTKIARELGTRTRSLVGRPLTLTPVS
jgi:ATP-binding protein involved in chromosome partitioning